MTLRTSLPTLLRIQPASEGKHAIAFHDTDSTPVTAAALPGIDVGILGAGPDSILGTDGNDTLLGEGGNDTIDGGLGHDSIDGGTENDSIVGGGGYDTLVGGAGNDTLVGGSEANDMFGGDGDDLIQGGDSSDRIQSGAGNDTMTGGDGFDSFYGNLIGDTGLDVIDGGAGNDQFVMADDTHNAINTIVTGGIGADQYRYGKWFFNDFDHKATTLAPHRITDFNLAEGDYFQTDFFSPDFDFTLAWRGQAAAAFTGTIGQSLALAGSDLNTRYAEFWTFHDTAIGRTVLYFDRNHDFTVDANDVRIEFDGVVTLGKEMFDQIGIAYVATNGADNLTFGADEDTVYGGAGNDTMRGGDEPYVVFGDLLYGEAGDDVLYGDGGMDYLHGGSGNDKLIQGAGAGFMYGGAGADTLQGGVDNEELYADYSTYARIYGTGDDVAGTVNYLFGAGGNDKLYGGVGNDILDGGTGNDTMDGGAGNDTFYVDAAGDVTQETLASGGIDLVISTASVHTLGTDVENLRLNSALASNGIGNALDNLIYAGAGNNVINGGGGSDTVSYVFATAGVTATLATVAAQATGGSGTDTLASIENLFGSNFADTLTGNVHANTLNGGAGNDTLDGGAGADKLVGGAGADTYYIDSAADLITETDATAAGGIDVVISSLASTVLGTNLENLRLTSAGAANAFGNALDNLIWAGAGDNFLNGGAGIDALSYAFAASGVTVDLASTALQATGGSGMDRLTNFENLTGSDFADTLRGNAADNKLDGGAGNDTLWGGGGFDTLTGGAGADTFLYTDTQESWYEMPDTIVGFSRFSDKIDLSLIDAYTGIAGDQAFTFIGSAAFDGNDASGQIRYANGMLYASIDADTDVELSIYVQGAPALTSNDFIL